MFTQVHRRVYFIVSVSLLLAACSSQRVLMPTPNIYANSGTDPYLTIHDDLKTTEVPLLYVTDRVPEKDKNGNLEYGYGRSPSLAFGTTVVNLGKDISWEQLVAASQTQKRVKSVPLTRGELHEIARGPETPTPFREVDGVIVEEPDYRAKNSVSAELFRKAVVERLSTTPRKEVFVYVHGYHNSFNDAAFVMAEFWHFLGRVGVPIVYTWPANHPGLAGYTYDRESSEFTVFHFRELIVFLASFPEVEKINIIAHSRGTDVAVTALRELAILARGAGKNARQEYKIHNFVLAAPDLDVQVASQRIIGDRLVLATNRFTIYNSTDDKAIGWSNRLFASPKGRVGNFQIEEVSGLTKISLERGNSNVAIINYVPGKNEGGYGHSYFRESPSVSSDLILMLRDDLEPGSPGRPMEDLGTHFWRILPGYPAGNSK